MKNKKNELLILIILILSGNNFVLGQNQGTSSLQFLKIIPSAKIMGMGEAGVSIQNDADAAFINPSGLAKVKNFDLRISTVNWFLDTKIYAITAAYTYGNMGSIGININKVDYGEFDETRVDMLHFVNGKYNPGLTGRTFTASAMQFGLSYAKALTDKFSFGITTNYIREDLYLKKMETFTFNFGITFDSKVKSLKLGIALRNLGPNVKYLDAKNPIPQTMIIGFSGYLFSDKDNIIMQLKNHKLNIAFDIVKPRDDNTKYHLGLDYQFYKMIDFRAGYKINYDIESFTFGVGIRYKLISLDYSYNDLGEFWNSAQRFSLGIEL